MTGQIFKNHILKQINVYEKMYKFSPAVNIYKSMLVYVLLNCTEFLIFSKCLHFIFEIMHCFFRWYFILNRRFSSDNDEEIGCMVKIGEF